MNQCYVEKEMLNYERTLTAITENAAQLNQVYKMELQPGDWLFVTTVNSTYNIRALGDDSYTVSGGWFDRNGLSPFHTWIAGCTWGGSVIKVDIVAACGLHLEFGNRVVTSPIRKVRLFRPSPAWDDLNDLTHVTIN